MKLDHFFFSKNKLKQDILGQLENLTVGWILHNSIEILTLLDKIILTHTGDFWSPQDETESSVSSNFLPMELPKDINT